MAYKIVAHDVDLTPEEQEMAAEIMAAYRRWLELLELEREAWRIFKDEFYDSLRQRMGDRNKLQSAILEGDKITLSYRPGTQMPGTILADGKQVRFYRVEKVEEV